MEGQALSLKDAAPESAANQIGDDFTQLAGSVIVLGYDELGESGGVSIEAREFVNDRGNVSRGALATVKADQYRSGSSFLDLSELPELLKGIDALVSVQKNPTKFANFEIKYKTEKDLEITAFNSRNGGMSYAIRSGTAQVFVQANHLRRISSLLQQALTKVQSL